MSEPMLSVPRRLLDAVLKDMACMADHAVEDCPAAELKRRLTEVHRRIDMRVDGGEQWLILLENDSEMARMRLQWGTEMHGVVEGGKHCIKFTTPGASQWLIDHTPGMTMDEVERLIRHG